MINTVIIRGLFEFVQQLILVAIAKDLPIKLVVATQADEAPRYQALITASLTCRQFALDAQLKPDYSQADSLIIGNLVPLAADGDASGDLKATLPLFRSFVNDAMGAGFNGKIVLAGSNDAVLSVLAAKFSGIDHSKVIGVGTLPQSRLLEQLLRQKLSVGPADVRAFVVGTAAAHLISWSRSYIGPAPVMTYLANQDISFGMDEMTAATDQIDDATMITNQTLSVLALVQILNAFYAQTPFIGTVTNIQASGDDDQLVGLSSPVLISANGLKRMADMVLSDEEQKEYAEIAGQVREELARVTAGELDEDAKAQ
ncbi:lactate dehydrogenase [Lactiplantibacillus pentosus]|uniref:lactate dehydrogenase n=1 Tax=Lactiplantibacillus pentosus TaxID=1589 RepID=UPI0021A3D85A|nr:lactate dehydrogenase [Lactiplantibacillus pentosus]MCT3329401.1 lactate dehydrogenase [Lactiplantibacillus pentosus]